MFHQFCPRRSWRMLLCDTHASQTSFYFSTVSSIKHLNGHCVTDSPLALSFLQESCGLSLEDASLVCKKVHLVTSEKAQTVVNVLQDQKFAKSQIAKLISIQPKLLLTDTDEFLKPNFKAFASVGLVGAKLVTMVMMRPSVLKSEAKVVVQTLRRYGFTSDDILTLTMKVPAVYTMKVNKTLKPKIDFFRSLGFTVLELRKFLKFNPNILRNSLENAIIPFARALRRLLGDDEKVVNALKRWKYPCPMKVIRNLETRLVVLENHGVSVSLILRVFSHNLNGLYISAERLNMIINYAKTLDLDPKKYTFAALIYCKSVMSDVKWEQKIETYKSYGFTDEEIDSVVRKQPLCMKVSVKKIKQGMNFFLKALKMKPEDFVKYPGIMLFSFEKRIIPRCSTMHLLGSKNVIKTFNLTTILTYSNERFFKQMVEKYEKSVPEVVKAFQGEIEFQGLYKGYWKDLEYCFENNFDGQSA